MQRDSFDCISDLAGRVDLVSSLIPSFGAAVVSAGIWRIVAGTVRVREASAAAERRPPFEAAAVTTEVVLWC